jgi:hypothetical protein
MTRMMKRQAKKAQTRVDHRVDADHPRFILIKGPPELPGLIEVSV